MSSEFVLDINFDPIVKLECLISDHIAETSPCYTHFEYSELTDSDLYHLKIITFNRIHRQTFLLKHFIGESRQQTLEQALDYIKHTIKTENNYIVKWTEISTQSSKLSYFRGYSENDVKVKFYCQVNNIENIQLDNIVLCPIS